MTNPVRVYRAMDAPEEGLAGEAVAVLGYGHLGRTAALNLRDSGAKVRIGNREDAYAEQARSEGFEVVPIPRPDAAIEQTSFCYEGKRENTRLAPVFGRPRIAVGLPVGFALEASFVPPVKMWDAEPLLASMAISNARVLPFAPGRSRLTLLLRAQGTVGRVRGPITCPSSGLQTGDPNSPCFGSEPSRDTFHPYMFGGDGALSLATADGKWSVYAGGGVSWLRPRFQVGFTDGVGTTDSTRISVDLTRGALFGGVSARVWRVMRLSAQVYSVPADATVWRFGFDYVIR